MTAIAPPLALGCACIPECHECRRTLPGYSASEGREPDR